jgi:ABC-type transporter Mla subunit MlaD
MRYGILSLLLLMPACELIEEPKGQFHARMQDAGGLREGAPVFVAGVRAGRVGIVKIDGDRARVDFTMDKDAKVVVRDDACVSVQWYGAGDAHLRLRPGSGDRPSISTGEITCVESGREQLDAAMDKATELLEGVVSGKGTVGRLLRDEALADKVERFFERGPELPLAGTAPDVPAPSGAASIAVPAAPSTSAH